MATIDVDKKIKDLEENELQASGGIASPQQYGQLLTLYLIKYNLADAKFLWKRIPSQVKNGNPELGQIWDIGRKMWLREYPEIYKALQKDWSENVKNLMSLLQDTIREQVMILVSKAYSSILYDELAALLGCSVAETMEAARLRQWDIDVQNQLVLPKRLEPKTDQLLPSDKQMGQLADYVSFLEN